MESTEVCAQEVRCFWPQNTAFYEFSAAFFQFFAVKSDEFGRYWHVPIPHN